MRRYEDYVDVWRDIDIKHKVSKLNADKKQWVEVDRINDHILIVGHEIGVYSLDFEQTCRSCIIRVVTSTGPQLGPACQARKERAQKNKNKNKMCT